MRNRCPASLHLSSAEKEADITLKTQHKQELIRSKCFVLRDSKKFFFRKEPRQFKWAMTI